MADTLTRTLEMVFQNQVGKSVTVSVKEPKDGLTLAEVQAVMDTIIAKNIFATTGGDLVSTVEAQIRQTAITELA
ncbi:DUF2922 family protein [Anaerospora hongkongensis]|uniref:DUF2922 family protein n=1 Tax=Anaerospora hongkongensis TaxID=244830 RepID=A0A4R1Q2U0_9FIRM|nr:DUF2922 domain-containing protein [Anaerospora hongkongensis]TCL38818.1 DUF2922 family protein [Anaerospora hongkongensis]